MKRVVHLIPYEGIGGVEVAARSVPTGRHEEIFFERQYLVRPAGVTPDTGEYHGPEISLNDPRAYWHALRVLLRDPPDLLVASLWRSALVLICLRILRPRARMVLFLHSTFDVHILDKLVNKAAMKLCDAIWADSSTTLSRRVPHRLQGKGRVISLLVDSHPLPAPRHPAPRFIFWGRLNAQKGLERALSIFELVARKRDDAMFLIVGPDGGMAATLRDRVTELDLAGRVSFGGPMNHDEIFQQAACASFYLQTSPDEGMALSVVEAMQAGLVPVVTPVGEIARYCHDGETAVFVHEDMAAVDAVLAVLSDPDRYRRMSRAAAEYWRAKPLYRDDFLAAARDLIGNGDRAHEA